jgi:hypothetical protein
MLGGPIKQTSLIFNLTRRVLVRSRPVRSLLPRGAKARNHSSRGNPYRLERHPSVSFASRNGARADASELPEIPSF